MNNLWPNIILKLRELKIEINSFEKINHGNNSEVFYKNKTSRFNS